MRRKPPMLKKCEKCPLVDENQFVPAEPALQEPTLIVIAEAPGATEVEKGRPLVGQAGNRYRRDLARVGGNPLRCVHLNTVNCRPKGNMKPTPVMIRRCREYVNTVLAVYPDLPLLLLGDVAGRAFIDKEERFQLTKDRGYAYDTNANREAFLTFHPSFINRVSYFDPVTVDVWEHDLQRAWDWAVGNFKYQNEFDYRVSCQPDEIVRFVEDLPKYAFRYGGKPMLAVDIETTGLDPRKDRIIGLAMCRAPNEAIAVKWPETQDEVHLAVQSAMTSRMIGTVFQNGLFDIEFLTLNGIEVMNYAFDTRYASHCTIPDGSKYLRPHSLRFLNSMYTNLPSYKSEYTEVYGGTGEVDVDTVQELACHDTNATLQIAKRLADEHETLGLTDYFARTLMPIMPTLNDMHIRGVKINVDMLESMRLVIVPKLKDIEAAFHGVNLNSTKQVIAFLLDIGVKLTKRTEHGQYSVDNETLQDLVDREENQEHSETLQLLLAYNDLKKTEGTYCTGLLKRLHNDRLHTSFSVGPSTGRLASSDPNLQNIPESIRSAFVPDKDMAWIKADYRQVELYVAALEYEDENLLARLRGGVDVHDLQQRLCFGSDYSKEDKRQRRIAKTVIFGTLYGRGARAIAVMFGVSIERAKEWQNAFFNAYPKIQEGQQAQYQEAKSTGIIRSRFGNIRQTREFTKIVNHPIQADAAGVLFVALERIGKNLEYLQPLLTVHDEVDFQAPLDMLAHNVSVIRSCMSSPVPQLGQFCFPVDIKAGATWSL